MFLTTSPGSYNGPAAVGRVLAGGHPVLPAGGLRARLRGGPR